jgi:hypothetical protein
VHRVFNPRNFGERAVSLHVYSQPFDTCIVYSPEHGTCGEINALQHTLRKSGAGVGQGIGSHSTTVRDEGSGPSPGGSAVLFLPGR